MRRIFLDSSVIIAACGSRSGASHAVIVMAEIGLFKVLWILIACAVVAGIQFLTVIVTRLFKLNLQLLEKLFFSLAWGAIAAVSSEWFPMLRSIRYHFLSPFSQPQWLIFFGSLGFSVIFSYYATGLVRLLIRKTAPKTIDTMYKEVIQPIDRLVQIASFAEG